MLLGVSWSRDMVLDAGVELMLRLVDYEYHIPG